MTQHHPAALAGLKTAYGLLVSAVGGMEAASAVLGGYPTSRISDAASLHHPDRWPRLDHVAELEAVAPRLHGTEALARLGRCGLVQLAPAAGCATTAALETLSTCGRYAIIVAEAVRDGRISEAERAALSAQAGEMRRAAAALEAALAGPPLPLRGSRADA